jgi:predicted dehydrogenase
MDGSAWWRDQSKSGGQIFEQVTHIYDLATYLCGDVQTAHGLMRNLCHQDQSDYSIEDTSLGTLQFANGALGVITGSNCAVPVHFIGDFKLICENLTLDYTCTGQHWVTPDSAKIYHSAEHIEEFTEDGDPYLLESEEFISAIREIRPTSSPARCGLEAIQLIESVIADAKP